jgi:hypothetical protein
MDLCSTAAEAAGGDGNVAKPSRNARSHWPRSSTRRRRARAGRT